MKRQPYTNIQFNSLPGWARDHILALEHEAAAAPELLEALERAEATLQRLAPNGSRATQGTRDLITSALAKAKGE